MIDAPSGGAPEQAPRLDLVDTESYGGGIRVLAPLLIVWGYVDIFLVGGRALHPRGPHVAPPTYFFLLYIPTYPQTTTYGAKTLITTP